MVGSEDDSFPFWDKRPIFKGYVMSVTSQEVYYGNLPKGIFQPKKKTPPPPDDGDSVVRRGVGIGVDGLRIDSTKSIRKFPSGWGAALSRSYLP